MRARLVILLLAVAAAPLLSQPQAPPPVLRAMQDELARAMGGLKLKDQPAPYYGSCAVIDARQSRIQASLGAAVTDQSSRMRLMRVDVRIGDYAFDSSRFIAPGLSGGPFGSIGMLPVDDDDLAMRRQIWLSADATYKSSVQTFSRKKAAFQNRNDTDPIPDFSKETPVEHIETVVTPTAPVPATWSDVVRQVSDIVKGPDIVSSSAQLTVVEGTRYFVSSEGFRTVAPIRAATLRVNAEVLADDGMSLTDGLTVEAGSLDDMPKLDDLLARARLAKDRLLTTRGGKVGEDYSGPVLVEEGAAAGLLSQFLVPLFLSQRGPDAEDPRMTASQASANPFLTRIGSRVLPESFSVKDTPSLTTFNGVRTGGAYTVDDEGMNAQDVTLVQDGRLMTLLTSRTPQKNLLQSNGHSRDGGAQAGVIQFESTTAVPAAALKARYLALLKTQGRPFGYIVRRLTYAAGRPNATVVAAVKVTPDGNEEPVRGLLIGNVTHTTFRDIVAASQERTLSHHRASAAGSALMGGLPSPAGGTLVSVIAPSLIFEELDIQKSKEPLSKKPIVPSPVR